VSLTTAKILCVDDEPKVLRGLVRILQGKFSLQIAEGPERALEMLESSGPFGVVLADMRMPFMDGAELLAEVHRRCPDTVRMMLTGNADLNTAVRAVNEGNIFRFLNKPCQPEDLERALQDGLEQYSLVCAEREILEETLNGCVKVLTEILSLADPSSFQNAHELKDLSVDVAKTLGMKNPWEMQMAVMLAQLGRVTVPPEVLAKAEGGNALDVHEQLMMDQIPSAGGSLIGHIPRLEGVGEIVRQQRVDHDPKDEDNPPLGARILRVFMDMVRMEEAGLDRRKALSCLDQESGGHDPRVVSAIALSLGIGMEDQATSTLQIPFVKLCPGHVLAAPLVTCDGRMILREGHRIGHALMERLRNHQRMYGFREPVHIEVPAQGHAEESREAS